MAKKYDFSGYVTRYNVPCTDGRTIVSGAFDAYDGKTIPLVWNHNHDTIGSTLGNVTLEARPDGLYGYGSFNDTELANDAKMAVEHGDITDLSICANHLKQRITSPSTKDVISGKLQEVSLVYSGANMGAFIDTPVMIHADDGFEYGDGVIYLGEICTGGGEYESINHADGDEEEEKPMPENKNDKTIKDIYDGMTEEQKLVVAFMVQQALSGGETAEHGDYDDGEYYEGDDYMKHSAFENGGETKGTNTLMHSAGNQILSVLADKTRKGNITSLRDFVNDVYDDALQHADSDTEGTEYGIRNYELLFPDAKNLNDEPEFIKRDTTWVGKFMNATQHKPYTRFKTMYADITEDEARAKGYITATQKWYEVFPIFSRSIEPQTVYKLQKMDRDVLLDMTTINAIAFLKKEMRWMLDEEVARAGLVGDGRLPDNQFKIKEDKIKPIYKDNDLYAIKVPVKVTAKDDDTSKANKFIKACIKARKQYKGSGSPVMFITTDILTDMLLIEDGIGRPMYDTVSQLATKLRVSEIIECEVMEGLQRKVGEKTYDLAAIIVNPRDYAYGTDKGGEVTMFEDFDINFNQHEVLIETRCSGMLVKPKSALIMEFDANEAAG